MLGTGKNTNRSLLSASSVRSDLHYDSALGDAANGGIAVESSSRKFRLCNVNDEENNVDEYNGNTAVLPSSDQETELRKENTKETEIRNENPQETETRKENTQEIKWNEEILDDELHKSPIEVLAEFLSAVMARDYINALAYCKIILQYEPDNKTAQEFYPLIQEKIRLEAAAKMAGCKSDEDTEESGSSEEKENKETDSSTDHYSSADSGGENNSVLSFSSSEEEEEESNGNTC